MLICYQGYSELVRGILLMEMKDLLLAGCLVHTGFGGRACLKQSLGITGTAGYAAVCVKQ